MNEPAGFNDEELYKFLTLRLIIRRLRGPDGCPWDKKQTHRSLIPYLIEECYEVIDAINSNITEKVKEELGDLLLQIMLQAQIGEDEKSYSIDDVIYSINRKIIYRHPHVFGKTKISTAEEVAANWQLLKQSSGNQESILDGLPRSMPALLFSQAIQDRVAKVGFDWQEIEGILDKLVEEITEFKKASDSTQRYQEFGDILFTICNIARRMDVSLEQALREANARFCQRFSLMEKICRQRGKQLEQLSFEEQNLLWTEAKEQLKGAGGII